MMGSLRPAASRAAGWWSVALFCSFKDLSTNGSVRRPLFGAGILNLKAVNSATAIQLLNYDFQSISCVSRFTCYGERYHHPVVTRRSSTRRNPAQSSFVMTTDVTASSFSSSASSMSSFTVEPEDVIQFWFKDIDPENHVYMSKNWFFGGPEFDKEIEMKFGECVRLAADGALDGWKVSVRGRLALVIIFDQFSRNIYRKSPLAYANDEKARKITVETIAEGLDKQLAPMERNFFYLPLMHSENLEDHDLAATVYKGLAAEYIDNEDLNKQILNTLEFEEKHRAVLEQFGRYPSRNEDLGRQSTPEELKHLSKGAAW